MAATHSIPMDNFLSQYPQALREWIEQDLGWKAEDITDITLSPQVFELDPENGYRQFKPGPLDVSVTSKISGMYETKERQFLRQSGGWIKVGDTILPITDCEISYTADVPLNTTVSIDPPVQEKKTDIDDDEAFDLMDRIRRDMRHD